MIKIFVSLGLTVFLGPGVGHLYLGKFKKAVLLIGVTLIAAMHLAWTASKTFPSIANLTSETAMKFFQDFAKTHSNLMLIYDIVFAAIWAYALVDAFIIAKRTLPKLDNDSQEDDQNENK